MNRKWGIPKSYIGVIAVLAAIIMSVVGGPAFILLLRKARGTYGE